MRSAKNIFFVLFFGSLFIPGLAFLVGWQTTSESCENRLLQKQPSFSFEKSYFDSLKTHFEDHLMFRNDFTEWNAGLKVGLFASSPRPEEVVLGDENWMFYSSRTDGIFRSFTGADVLDSSAWKVRFEYLEKKRALGSELDFRLFLAILPNKATVYSEYLPASMKRLQVDRSLTKGNQLVSMVDLIDSVQVIDTRDFLISKKTSAQLFRKFDTHWNDLGAFYGYQEIIRSMGLQPFELDQFSVDTSYLTDGDLLKLMGLCERWALEDAVPTLSTEAYSLLDIKYDAGPRLTKVKNRNPAASGSILVFHDSFMDAMLPFISLHFKNAAFHRSKFDQNLIEEIKPDIVLMSDVERYL